MPWAARAAFFVDSRPDAKSYTPFSLPDAKRDLAAVVATLLADTSAVFGCVDCGPH